MNPPLVSYIVLTRNRCRDLIGCLQNLREQDYDRREIVLVDNHSTDDTASTVKGRFPEIHLVALDRNEGVGGGRNRGVEASRGEICIFIDDDARFADRDATRRIIPYFQRDETIACVAFRIIDGVTGVEDRKTIPRRDKRLMKEDSPVAYFCGAGFAIRRRIFLDMGGFWKILTYAGEEMDMSCRLMNEGYQLVYAASIRVAHYEAPAARSKGQWVYFQTRNRCWVAAKNLPLHYVLSTTFLWWAYAAWVSLSRRELKFFLAGVRDALAGLPRALMSRQCIEKPVVTKMKRLSGRIWY